MNRLCLSLAIIFCVSCAIYGQNQITGNIRHAETKTEQQEAPTNTNNNPALQQGEPEPSESAQTNAESKKEQSESVKVAQSSATAAWVQAIAGIMVLLFIAWQAYQTHRQGKENKQILAVMKSQAKTMRDSWEQGEKSRTFIESSFYIAERAYLAVENVKNIGNHNIGELLSAGNDPIISFEIVNGGRTPAFEVTAIVETAMTEAATPKPSDWKQGRRPTAADFIMPGKNHFGKTEGNFIPTNELHHSWKCSIANYFIRVKIEYWDIGGVNKCHITYVFTLHPEQGAAFNSFDTDTMPHRSRSPAYENEVPTVREI
ncbi:MAG TPA: hypothetical protein VGO50_06130 [Pyrinomonadaceae bacterium]|jgi:hypothetical protein|nr:hypothetical protein [Pyrinomonadaceae bacterium]